MIKRSCHFLKTILLGLFAPHVNADIVDYNFHWDGIGGYRVEGSFSYDNDTATTSADPLVTADELLSFTATAYTPTGVALKSYDLTNQGNFFNFNFNAANETLNQVDGATGGVTAFNGDGFFIGKLIAPGADDYGFSTFVGCGSAFKDSNNIPISGITLISRLDGSCNGMLLDYGGTVTVQSADTCIDVDGDGFGFPGNAACPHGAPEDCNDDDPDINPDAVEIPGNFIDENCNGDIGECDPCLDWKNHGQYVRCVSHKVEALVDSALITEEQGDTLVSSSAETDIGKKDHTPLECSGP